MLWAAPTLAFPCIMTIIPDLTVVLIFNKLFMKLLFAYVTKCLFFVWFFLCFARGNISYLSKLIISVPARIIPVAQITTLCMFVCFLFERLCWTIIITKYFFKETFSFRVYDEWNLDGFIMLIKFSYFPVGKFMFFQL